VRQNENANMTVLGIHEKVIEPEAKRKKAAPFHSLKKKALSFFSLLFPPRGRFQSTIPSVKNVLTLRC
jgi:hypothetical protein